MAEAGKRAGWYPSPDSTPGERWWNGVSWSDSRRGAPAVAPPPTYSASSPAPIAPASVSPPPPARGGVVDARQNRLAVVGLVLGGLGVAGVSILGPAAVVISLVAIARSRRLVAQGSSGSSAVLSVVGLILGLIATGFLIVAIVAFISAFTVDFTAS